tara:strand:+ start:56 stop:415 length:360 start_codon:yes stop_codon:yes gene_type:complete
MSKREYKGITLFGKFSEASSFIVTDEQDEYIINNWNSKQDREFSSWDEAVDYIIKNYNFYGDIQEIKMSKETMIFNKILYEALKRSMNRIVNLTKNAQGEYVVEGYFACPYSVFKESQS